MEAREILLKQLRQIQSRADVYFERASKEQPERGQFSYIDDSDPDYYWERLSEDTKALARAVVRLLMELAPEVTKSMMDTPFLATTDLTEFGHAVKSLRASLQLRIYSHWEADVLHDEGIFHGVTAAGQSYNSPQEPRQAAAIFSRALGTVQRGIELCAPIPTRMFGIAGVRNSITMLEGYRPGTAFIMMMIDPQDPSLEDVLQTVKRSFRQFEIEAVRADDIEHEGVINEKILEEIRTSEFLFADLTGERPSVYYEVGYAHSLGRRVILFRKTGTRIHFDLSHYNCPEYANLADLEKRLKSRLTALTGKRERTTLEQ